MSSVIEELALSVRRRHAILFVGAGVSMSVGLPSWQELIRHMASELQLDEDIVADPGVSYQTLAEFHRLTQGSIGPLRSWMDRRWSVSAEQVRNSRIHELIVTLDFPIVYTTNYDRNLEVAYEVFGRPYVKIANAKDITRIAGDATQIIKYHGDFEDDASLVLAETDYFDRLSFDSPLDIKFRADALGKTILFIGYSMSDLNIRLLLHRLWQTWKSSGYESDRPKSFVFMAQPNPIQRAVLGRWGIEVLGDDSGCSHENALISFLETLKRAVEAERGDDPPVRAPATPSQPPAQVRTAHESAPMIPATRPD